ncbi:hypothetical protein [Streptomyces umbrinus]|uniref:hypothetical protein n=1 Tax=Streptomyces umbrinus TaxID=67370 RepID=UPI0034093820
MSTSIVCEANTRGGTMSWDERRGFVRGDRRQIQTAVLGGADSEEPLMLPLEAIELDAFRRRHEHDTFWCGLLLGGCGGQLTTKLYTDRVCHFAHHPGPDGLPHLCGRHSRGVSSADHLYVKSAAASWLQGRGDHADFDFARPEGVPIGSVVDIQFQRGGLRVYLDQAVEPAWDEDGREPVLGVSVPVDTDTLIRRWYVHRIRLDSEGTTRRVRIGTEAFARSTEWFTLDDCEITERGLSTPAVEQIVRSRSSRPVSMWGARRAKKIPDGHAQAQVLLQKLAHARKVGAVVVVSRVCRDIAAVTGVNKKIQEQLTAAVSDAERWLVEQDTARKELFSRLEEAVTAGNIQEAGRLLIQVNAVASHERTKTENAIVDQAADCMAALARQRQAKTAARRAEQAEVRAQQAVGRVEELLAILERGQARKTTRKLVKDLMYAAAEAGGRLSGRQQEQVNGWKARSDTGRPAARTTRKPPVPPLPRSLRQKRKPLLHERVDRGSWFQQPCPRCHAARGKACLNDDGIGNGKRRQLPHDERLQLILSAGKSQSRPGKPRPSRRSQPPSPPQRPDQRSQPPSPRWQVVDVACPSCDASPGTHCKSSDGRPHQPRVSRFRRRFPSR